MRTEVLSVDATRPDESAIRYAASVLAQGGLVAFPTETVYGLGGAALDAAAVRRIFEAKGRPHHHPLIAHVLGVADAKGLAGAWPNRATVLSDAFWPGPLTLIVDRAPHVPAEVAGGGDSIAVRAPSHPVARALVRAFGGPIAAPSANRYQTLSPTRAEHVLRSLEGRVDLVLDAGACAAGIESTVVDVRGARPRVLRPGALDLDRLRAVDASIEAAVAVARTSDARPSPGMDEKHYAPRAPLELVANAAEAIAALEAAVARGERAALLAHAGVESAVPIAAAKLSAEVVLLPGDPEAYGQRLYAALHLLDTTVDRIVAVDVPEGAPWWAVRDRLGRARTRKA
jgi:L-threonylcarbamoyladenylate synthase